MNTLKLYVSLPAFQCDPEVDGEILALAAMAREAHMSDKNFDIHTLQNEPMLFVTDKVIAGKLEAEGDDALPITVLDDEVVLEGRYPKQDEVEAWLDMTFAPISVEKEAALQRAMAAETAMEGCAACPGCLVDAGCGEAGCSGCGGGRPI